jgi:hypothetical protein
MNVEIGARSFISGNICFEFSVQRICSAMLLTGCNEPREDRSRFYLQYNTNSVEIKSED